LVENVGCFWDISVWIAARRTIVDRCKGQKSTAVQQRLVEIADTPEMVAAICQPPLEQFLTGLRTVTVEPVVVAALEAARFHRGMIGRRSDGRGMIIRRQCGRVKGKSISLAFMAERRPGHSRPLSFFRDGMKIQILCQLGLELHKCGVELN
jgi:hypothetical protein